MIHELKIWPEYFDSILYGDKTFEFRFNDRNYQSGDSLCLKEFSPVTKEYTNRSLHVFVSSILYDVPDFGLKEGYCIMSIKHINDL